jgi:hypothetical protein
MERFSATLVQGYQTLLHRRYFLGIDKRREGEDKEKTDEKER